MPTKKPASAPSTPIKNRGKDGCNDGKCKLCEGDCDRDSDCKNGLRCFLREGLEPVPGCSGDGHGGESFGSQDESCSDHRVCPISSSSLITMLCIYISYLTFFLYTNHLQLGTIASRILKRSLQSDQEALALSQKACIHAFALFVVGKL